MEQNKALLERIRLFVLDLDGTIYLGDRAAARRRRIYRHGKRKGPAGAVFHQ